MNILWPIKSFEKYFLAHQYMSKMFLDPHKNVRYLRTYLMYGTLEEKIKNLQERCESMETELPEFYNDQIDPEHVYNKLVDLEDRSRRYDPAGLMVLPKGKVRLGFSEKRKLKIF